MALKDNWKDKVDGVDDILADDINGIAKSVIENEEAIEKNAEAIDRVQTPYIGDNGNWFIYDATTKTYVDSGNPARGEEGPQGDKGDPPVKGTDYWTEEDKAEIVEEVEEYADEKIEANTDEIAKNKEEAEKSIVDLSKASALQFANALKGIAMGEVIKVDDVSIVEHNVSVRVKPKNYFNISVLQPTNTSNIYAYISEIGADYIKIVTPAGHTGVGYANSIKTLRELCPQLEVGKTYTLYLNISTPLVGQRAIYLAGAAATMWYSGYTLTITETMLKSQVAFYGHTATEETKTVTISDIMIVEGTADDIPDSYIPYVDPSTVSLVRCGKNLYKSTVDTQTTNGVTITRNEDNSYTINGTATTLTYISLGSISANDDLTYYLSGGVSSTIALACQLRMDTTNINTVYSVGGVEVLDVSQTSNKPYNNFNLVLVIREGVTSSNVVVKPMISFSSDPTYEPYIKSVNYQVEADGTVDGVTSLSPTMTLLTDTSGVTIECEYNRDAEKEIAEVKEASSLQFSNALKGVVSGEAIRVDDVSPVSHNVSVKVRSANILDYTKFRQSQTISGITYTRSDDVMTIDGTATDTIYIFPWSPNIILGKEGDSFEMSAEHIGGTVNEGSVTVTFNIGDTVDGAVIPWRSISSQSLQGGVKALPYTPSYLRNFYIYLPAGTSVSNYSFKLKLAKGSAVTAYTPYINDLRGVAVTVSSDQDAEGEVYIPNSEGVIEGIKSKSLNMTLATDTEGVIIDLEYNKDINKAIEELTNAIISLGGNV